MADYKPAFTITDRTTSLLCSITERICKLRLLYGGIASSRLKRENLVRSVRASIAIEQNTLSLEQVAAISNGGKVMGSLLEIHEAENALKAYEDAPSFDPGSIDDLLKAHGIMAQGLVRESGCFRHCSVGVLSGRTLIHLAPPAERVPGEIEDLFAWYRASELHPLIKSAVFHYEFEFIHPFADGNGRMGRLWHKLLLCKWDRIFLDLPFEEFIERHLRDYYASLGKSEHESDSGVFVELMLMVILEALSDPQTAGCDGIPLNVQRLIEALGLREMSSSELMEALSITRRQTLRDSFLAPAIKLGLVAMKYPDKPQSRSQKYLVKRR